jgi:hypothetical protein
MLPIYAQLVRRATEAHVLAALPHAPVQSVAQPAPVTGTRRILPGRLVALAGRA